MGNVLKVSEAASLALHSMALLSAREGQLLSTRKIAETLRVSEAHLSKVLQRLNKQGLVTSIRGPRGGFKLETPGSQISLLDVYEAIEGRIDTKECVMGEKICLDGGCIFGGFLESATRQLRDYLGESKLSDFTHLLEKGEDNA